jgi:antitoxin VapB
MAKTGVAKVFRNGRSQAVRLPKEFRFDADRVRIRRVADGVLLEPLIPDAAQWFAELDRVNSQPFMKPFMKKARRQPAAPRREIFK